MHDWKLVPRIFSLHWSYWVLFAASVVLLAASRRWGKTAALRGWIFTAVQLAGLLLIADIDARALLFFVLPLLLAVYLAGTAVVPGAGGRRRGRLAAAVLLPVAALVFTKYALAGGLLGRVLFAGGWKFAPVPVIGLSYMVFKAVHYLVDVSSGRIVDPSLRSYLAFMLFLPTYLSGPMDRYARFRDEFEHPAPLSREEAADAGWRIAVGLFKKVVLASLCAPYAFPAFSTGELAAASPRVLWMAAYAYSLQIYFDFSGYSDLAIASGRFMGIRVPENFHSPYLKRNIIEFWNAWHVTLSHWLRDYLFLPVGKFFMKRRRARGGYLHVAAASYLVTFAIGGAWHGDGLNYLAWGVYHGMGLALCKTYSELSRRFPPAYHRFMQETPLGKAFATGLTFHFVAAGWILFANDLPRAALVFRRLAGGA